MEFENHYSNYSDDLPDGLGLESNYDDIPVDTSGQSNDTNDIVPDVESVQPLTTDQLVSVLEALNNDGETLTSPFLKEWADAYDLASAEEGNPYQGVHLPED